MQYKYARLVVLVITQAGMNFSDFIVAKDSEEKRREQYVKLKAVAKRLEIDDDAISDLPDEIHKHLSLIHI